jgi:regulator of protease activity HflC (stomatin/prohibitin superfamily)
MLPEILGVFILIAVIAVFEPTRVYVVPFFILALAVVFVIEAVRVVPQQNAWVVERLGRFHAALEPGLNITAITQLSQTTLRSEVGKMELDKTLESRDGINKQIVSVLDEAGRAWGVKVLRYEIKNLTPPDSILRSMQAQITAERKKRAAGTSRLN